jgi:micrococcal nuclease
MKVECFGKEASDFLKNLLTGKEVKLESDPSQADRDKYSRLLRYVYLDDGTFVNKKIVEDGFGYEYTYNLPYKFQKEFKEAQKQAEVGKMGLWADGICGR